MGERVGDAEPGPEPSPPRGRLRLLVPGAADLAHYRRAWLRPDALAGLAVWAVVVPQGLAYGELAGLSPVAGLYTALGAMLLYPLMGSSRYVNVGPESSIAIVTAAYIGGLAAGAPERAAELASLLCLVAAGFLLFGAVLRLAVVARLMSTPVLAGYLTGSAVVIGASQLGKLFAIPTPAEQWWRKLAELASALPTTNLRATLIGTATVLVVVTLLRWAPGVPGSSDVVSARYHMLGGTSHVTATPSESRSAAVTAQPNTMRTSPDTSDHRQIRMRNRLRSRSSGLLDSAR